MFTTGKNSLEEYCFLGFDVGHDICVVIDFEHKHPLMRIAITRIGYVIQYATFCKGKDTVIEAHSPPCDIPAQGVRLYRIPNDLFHVLDCVYTIHTEYRMNKGILFILSAPSGAGKTSLIKALLECEPGLSLAVSFTTRAPRSGEQDGVHYHFVEPDQFERMVAAGEFLEHAQVFGNRYGTAESTVRSQLEQGRDLLLEIDWQGARQVRTRFAQAVSVFILPPSAQALEQRLRSRGLDSDQVIAGRMAEARAEMSHYPEYDYLVVNDRFDTALNDLVCLVGAERLRRSHSEPRLRSLLAELTGQN